MFRKRNIEYTIPAHTKLVSNVRFEKNTGDYLVSSSYDGTAKVKVSDYLVFDKYFKTEPNIFTSKYLFLV